MYLKYLDMSISNKEVSGYFDYYHVLKKCLHLMQTV